MSDEEDEYEYEYDEDEEDNMEEENQFQYTDEEDEPDDGVVALENAYYNAKGLRETSVREAAAALEQVIAQEQEQLQKEGKKYGMWSYKAMKQLVKLYLRVGGAGSSGVLDQELIMRQYRRLLDCISTNGSSEISPAAIEKGINSMLERVASLNYNARPSDDGTNAPRTLALAVYDATLAVFHPQTGPCKIERLWFKTNLKYGQLLYEMNETAKLESVLKELIQIHGEPDDVVHSPNHTTSSSSGGASVSTNSMEIYALQIQLYSRQKDNRKLRETFQKAMNVRGGIPHPRTIALIQELGGKMYMSHNEYEEASKTFFQAFKSYDEAGDPSRLRCLKYLVLASMLHASSINPFDSQEARPYRDDPEIVVMTNLVKAFHNNEIQTFERILRQNQGRIMDDAFIRTYVEDLLRTIRTQVLRRFLRPYERISLSAIATALNDIPMREVENLLLQLILEGNLDGWMDGTSRVLYKRVEYGGGDSSAAGNAARLSSDQNQTMVTRGGSNPSDGRQLGRSRNKSETVLQLEAMNEFIGILEDVSRQNTSTSSS